MTRKDYGSGSLFRRKDGLWEATATIQGKRKSFYGKIKSEARGKRDDALAKAKSGDYVESSRQKVGDYLTAWLEAHAVTTKLISAQTYRLNIKNHLIPHLGHIPLQKLQTEDIQKMCAAMGKSGLQPATIRKNHQILSTALNDAVKTGKLAKNPAKFVKLPRLKKREHIILDEDQASRLIMAARDAQANGKYIGTVVLLLIGTGMRIGELLALHWSQIDFEKKTLRIGATVSHDFENRMQFESEPKSESSARTLPLPQIALEALNKHRINQKQERRWNASNWPETDLIFASPRTKSGHMWPASVRRNFYVFLQKECDLPTGRAQGIVPHDLRHNVATALLAAGIPMKTVSEMLGHSDIRVTVDVYGHVTQQMQEQASNTIDQIYGQQG